MLTVNFDRAVQPGAVNTGNFSAAHASKIWSFTAAVASGTTVVLTPNDLGPGPADELLDFDPPPFDLLDLVTGLHVELFHGQAIT